MSYKLRKLCIQYENDFKTYYPHMKDKIESTRENMCNNALYKLKTKLIEINDNYIEEKDHNLKTHDMTHRIMTIFNSFSRVNELLERIKFRFYLNIVV